MAAAETALAATEEEIDYEGLGDNVPLHINMIAGALAGISEHAFMFPVDVIRVSDTPLRTDKISCLITVDKDADSFGITGCNIYRRHTGIDTNQQCRRSESLVARSSICHYGGWPSPCGIFWGL